MHPKKPLREVIPVSQEVESQPRELRITIPRRKDSDVSEPPPEPERSWVVSCLCCCVCWPFILGCLEG